MLAQLKNPRLYVIAAADSAIFAGALIGAYLLRFDFKLFPVYHSQIATLLALSVPTKLFLFFLFGLYRGMWRYCSLHDLWRLAEATFLATLINVAAVVFFFHLQGFPRSIFLLDGLLTAIFSGGLRLSIRSFYGYGTLPKSLAPFCWFGHRKNRANTKSVVIVGAGGAGEKMLREIWDNSHLNYEVIGFLDDDQGKWGRTVHGVKVLGSISELPLITSRCQVDEVIIAVPSATGSQMRRIHEICNRAGVSYRTLPAIGSIIDGRVSIKMLRDVKYEDLLRREPVQLDMENISAYLTKKRVLVTGAGGSIGSELCRQIRRFEPESLILTDAGEANLYAIQIELQHELKFHRFQPVLARVQDKGLMEDVFSRYSPEVVFHAAAYKHVPLLEKNPWEAVFNNVAGTMTISDLAVRYGVARFVLVSTDKAVRPVNVMGASKRLCELIIQAKNGRAPSESKQLGSATGATDAVSLIDAGCPGRTRFMAVRFGNVVGSSGSVIPLFRRQIEQGGPVTVTHPEVTRYFMTIPEAAQLILQAGALGEGGEIFILEMGTAINIATMAEELVRLSGKEPGRDIEIIYTGLREGEKLYEELITDGEGIVSTTHEKIMVLRADGQWNRHGDREAFRAWIESELDDLYRIASTHDSAAIKKKLQEILPEYKIQNAPCVLDKM